jgi:hypothetical protein
VLELEIFRFLKLPTELRLRVYDFTIKAKGTLRYKNDDSDKKSWLALNLRGVNKQVNQETTSIFLRNNFRILDPHRNPAMSLVYEAIGPRLREVTFEWWAWAIKDNQTLAMIRNFAQLKIFNLVITRYCVNRQLHGQRRQYTHQNVDCIKKFSKSNGFDAIMTLRGLERVNVSNSKGLIAADANEVSHVEISRFEIFLNEHLTMPRAPAARPVSALKCLGE